MGSNGHIKFLKPVFNTTRDISHLPRWKQWVYWAVFVPLLRKGFRLGLPVLIDKDGARVDVLSVAETDAIAGAIVATIGPSAFYAPRVPVNVMLPVAAVIFGGMRAPYSPMAALHEQMGNHPEVATICPINHGLCTRHESLPLSTVEDLYKQVKTAVAS